MVPDLSGLTLALTAGALALLSPCGFPMLPGYISYYIGAKTSLERAIPAGIVCTSGLLAVFSMVGLAVSAFGSLASRYISFLELVAGVLVILMGIIAIARIRFPTLLGVVSKLKAPKARGLSGIFLYGVAYGLATLACSAPIFFSMLFYALASGGPLYGLTTFIVYAIGMGIPLLITTILVAKVKKIVLEKIVRLTPLFQEISGIILILIGIYILYYYAISPT